MINLLPTKEKEELAVEKTKKLVVVLGLAVLVGLVCLVLVLLSVKFYILGEVVSQEYTLKQAEDQYKTPDFLNYKNLLENYNKKVLQLKNLYSSNPPFSAALKTILNVKRPDTLYFSNLSLEKESNGKITAKLFGISDTRENLQIFKSNLEGAKEIKNAIFSPESWIASKNVDFYLVFDIDSENGK